MVYMVPNGVSLNVIGHHRNGLYGAQWCFFKMPLGTIEMVYMVPNGVFSNALGTIEMVYMVPNGVSLNSIGHHRNGLYGAQWCLNQSHWAP